MKSELTNTTELHLLKYNQVHLEYLQSLESHPHLSLFQAASLKPFSAPHQEWLCSWSAWIQWQINYWWNHHGSFYWIWWKDLPRQIRQVSTHTLRYDTGMSLTLKWVSCTSTSSRMPFIRSYISSSCKSDHDGFLWVPCQTDERQVDEHPEQRQSDY